jgi:hypothetical protein
MMPGISPESFLLDANIRILRGTPLTTPIVKASTQTAIYGAVATTQGLAGGPQAAPCIGVVQEDITESGFPLTQATNPSSSGIGSAPPSPYDLTKRSWSAAIKGRVKMFAYDGNIKQGDRVCIALDGVRIQSIRAAFAPGLKINRVGVAATPSTAINDFVEVDLDFGIEAT